MKTFVVQFDGKQFTVEAAYFKVFQDNSIVLYNQDKESIAHFPPTAAVINIKYLMH